MTLESLHVTVIGYPRFPDIIFVVVRVLSKPPLRDYPVVKDSAMCNNQPSSSYQHNLSSAIGVKRSTMTKVAVI